MSNTNPEPCPRRWLIKQFRTKDQRQCELCGREEWRGRLTPGPKENGYA